MSGPGNGRRPQGDRRIRSFLERKFRGDFRCERLAGDASDRTFYRVRIGSMGPLVAMVHPEPFDVEELPYFVQSRFFKEFGAAVPEIVSSYPSEGILLIQDLGDETLMRALETATPERRLYLYRQAVQIIAFMQEEGLASVTPESPAARSALDRDRLLFELRFFMEHYVEGLLGGPLDDRRSSRLEEWFEELAASVAGLEPTLCHRDYHSRNLMLRGDRLFMVDFQDARMGPYTYDLASLLRDSYVSLPGSLVEELLVFFLEVTDREARTEDGEESLPREFVDEFEMTCLQRNIKAVGTFAFQAQVKGNESYLPHISPTLGMIRENLRRRGLPEILELFQGPLLLG